MLNNLEVNLDENDKENSVEKQPSCSTSKTENENVDSTATPTSSAKKLRGTFYSINNTDDVDSFYVLFDSSILKELVQIIGNCPECLYDKVDISHCSKTKLGLCEKFILKCSVDGNKNCFHQRRSPKLCHRRRVYMPLT